MQLSNLTYSQFLETIPDAAIVADRAGKIVLANSLAYALLGYQPGELPGQSIYALIPETRTEQVNGFFVSPRTRPMGTGRKMSARRQDGSEFPIDIMLKPIELDGAHLTVCIVRDITKRLQAEKALRESMERYHRTLDNMLEGCQLIGFDWRYLYVNNAVARQGRRTKEELLGHTMMEVYPGIEATAMFAVLRRCMAERTPSHLENEFTYPDGALGWFELSIQPVPEGLFILSIDITARKRAEEEIERQLRQLRALRQIDLAITGTTNVYLALKTVLEEVTTQLRVDAADILLLNPHTHMLEYAAGRGFRSTGIERAHMRLGQGHAGRAALEQRSLSISNLAAAQDFIRTPLVAGEDFVAYYALPLVAKGNVNGVLEIFHRAPLNPKQEWLDFFEALAGQAAIAVDNSRLFKGLQRANVDLLLAYDTTIEGWSHALDLRDKETEGHTLRVTEMTLGLARAAGLTEDELVHVRRGALLHDIGKMGVSDTILLKPDKLTDEEWAVMRQHPTYAYELLSPIAYLRPALDIPYCHHEKWDGSGYPRGLKGEQIPLAARLFAVVDVWDALRSDRPYRQGWPEEKVVAYIRAQAGTHFDPKAVQLFSQVMSEKAHEHSAG
ncbi:MAG TPA: HD domain-containing phosphohydrolase [Anaerolineales bacterium]|nr:HD domain-containing phosphohydrolase [Anaerolineales bacterium]